MPALRTKPDRSAAKGNGGIYYYYHCQLGCKERVKAEEANNRFVQRLGRIIPKEKYLILFEKVAEHTYHQNSQYQTKATIAVEAEIEKHRQRIANAQQLMLDSELSAADYKEIKARYEPEIARLERKKKGIAQIDDNLLEYVSATSDLLRNLPNYYKTAALSVKQKLIGSICSGKLVFAENDYQTMQLNDLIQGIIKLGEHFDGLEKGQASISGSLSEEVTPSGLLIDIDFQLFVKIVDHFVDLEPKNWAILTAFYMGEFVFTKIKERRDLSCYSPACFKMSSNKPGAIRKLVPWILSKMGLT